MKSEAKEIDVDLVEGDLIALDALESRLRDLIKMPLYRENPGHHLCDEIERLLGDS